MPDFPNPDPTDLLKRAEYARARNQLYRDTPGLGYHDHDRDHLGRLRAPQHNGKPAIDQHVIAFHSDDEAVFVGPCAERVRDALAADLAGLQGGEPADLPGSDRKRLKVLPGLLAQPLGSEVPFLAIRKPIWDDVLGSIYRQGLGITGLDLGA